MEIIIGKTAGFCYGVNNAYNKALEYTIKYKNICCFGELVHNKEVNNKLESLGLTFINDINKASNKVIICSHGTTKENYEVLKNNNVEALDLTCPNVLKIHKIIEEYKDYFIFIVGQHDHAEMIGNISFCNDHYVIESINDIEEALKHYNNKPAILIAQTTYSLEIFNKIENILKENIPNLIIKNTICHATKERQIETNNISKNVDLIIIIGSKNSSNSKKLYEISLENCTNVLFIENVKELDKSVLDYEKIGIMAGASTPKDNIDDVIKFLNKGEI